MCNYEKNEKSLKFVFKKSISKIFFLYVLIIYLFKMGYYWTNADYYVY